MVCLVVMFLREFENSVKNGEEMIVWMDVFMDEFVYD